MSETSASNLQALMSKAAANVAQAATEPVQTIDDVLDVPDVAIPPQQEIQPVVVEQPHLHTTEVAQAVKAVVAETKAAAVEVTLGDNSIVSGIGTLALHEALKIALNGGKSPTFKVASLQSGYTAEIGALAFEDINRIQASAVDAHAARMKLLKTLHSRILQFSCGAIKFQDWLKQTANGDYDTLMYGLYAATYPGENEFDTRCRHCGHENKVTVDVNQMARVESDDVYGEIRKLLDPKTDFKGAIQNSLVGRTVKRKLPRSGIIVDIRNPSIQDYLDGVQWFVASQDKSTGSLPPEKAGSEVIRTLTMYVPTIYVPIPGTANFVPITDPAERASLIGRLNRVDGEALTDAVNAENTRLEVSYSLPGYNCASCGKHNDELFLDFEALLFIKLREKA